MSERVIKLKIELTGQKEAANGVDSISNAFEELDRIALRSLTSIDSNFQELRSLAKSVSSDVTASQINDFSRVSSESSRIAEINARTQAKLAQEAARQVTQQKNSELNVFEATEKSKLKLTEQSAKARTQAENNASKEQLQFANIASREQIAAANRTSKEEIAEANNAAKAIENAKQREYQEFVRLEKEKANVAAAELKKTENQVRPPSNQSSLGKFAQIGQVFTGISSAVNLAEQTFSTFENIASSTVGTLFNLAKEASDYGSVIHDVGQKTGLSAESVSALKYAADISGSSLEAVSSGLTKFSKLVGEAGKGSKDAESKLKALGITPKQAIDDLDGTLAKVFKTISNAQPGIIQNNAAIAAFGKNGAALIPVILGVNGNLDEFKKKAAELGLVLSQKDADAADEFGDTLDTVKKQLGGATREFAFGFMPAFTDGMKQLSGFLADNKDAFRDWGVKVGDVLTGTIDYWVNAKDAAQSYYDTILKNAGIDPQSKGAKESSGYLGKAAKYLFVSPLLAVSDVLGDHGEEIRKAKEAQNLLNLDDSKIFKPKEFDADALKGNNEALAKLKDYYSARTSIVTDSLRVTEARLNSHLNLTSAEELQSIKDISDARKSNLQEQIVIQNQSFNQQLALVKGDAEETAKITNDKNTTLFKLNNDLKVNEYNTARQIAENEKKTIDERRQALIQFQQIQIQSDNNLFSAKSFDIDREISNQVGAASEGYAKLRDLTQKNFEQISALSIQSYQLQLQNLTLTKDQRFNLTQQMYLDEQNLAEQNRQKLIEIDDRQYQNFVSNLEKQRQEISAIYKEFGETYTSIQSAFFNPETFSSSTVKDFQTSALKSSQVDGLKAQIQTQKDIQDGIKNARSNVDNSVADGGNLSSIQLETVNKLTQSLLASYDAEGRFRAALDDINGAIPKSYFEFEKLAEQIAGGNVKAFDEAAKKTLEYKQLLDSADTDSHIDYLKAMAAAATTAGRLAEAQAYNAQLSIALRQKERQEIDQTAAAAAQYANSLEGLNAQLELLRSGDKGAIAGLQYTAQQNILREQISLFAQTIELQERLARVGEDSAERYKNAWLNATLEVKEADIRAVESQIASQVRLADAATVHTEQIRASVLSHLAEQQTLSEGIASGINKTYDALTSVLDKSLDDLNNKAKGFLSFITEPLKAVAHNTVSNIFSGILDSILPPELSSALKSTGNPLLDENVKQTKVLEQIRDGKGASNIFNITQGGANSGGSNPFNYFKGIFDGGGSSGGGGLFGSGASNGGLVFHAAGGNGTRTGDTVNDVMQVFAGDKGRGDIWSNVKNIFSGKGGIFGEKGFGNNVGTFGAIGAGAGLLGGLIGGRVGGVLSGAGSGLALGAQLGSIVPGIGTAVGAGVGAVVGGLLGLFGGGKLRKQEEKQRTEFLNSAFSSIGDFDKLISEVNALRVDPFSALTQGDALGKTIHDTYVQAASALKDKKTRNIALNEISGIDGRIAQKKAELEAAVTKASEAAEFSNKFVATFATGGYMDGAFHDQYRDFKRRNGYLTGGISGVDSLPSLLMPGEIVVNQRQAQRIRQMSGFDAFAYAGIPNYPKSKPVKLATGGAVDVQSPPIFSTPSQPSGDGGQTINFNGNIILENVVALPDAKAYLETPDGKKQVINIVRGHVSENKATSDGLARDLNKANRN